MFTGNAAVTALASMHDTRRDLYERTELPQVFASRVTALDVTPDPDSVDANVKSILFHATITRLQQTKFVNNESSYYLFRIRTLQGLCT